MEEITLNKIAKELNVSPQAVYQKVDKRLNNQLNKHKKIIKKGNRDITVYTREGAEIIKKAFDKSIEQRIEQTIEQPIEQQEKKQYKEYGNNSLDKVIEMLNKQLEVKDRQIEQLNIQLTEALSMNKNNQILLLNEQNKGQAQLGGANDSIEKQESKKSIFNIFRKH